MTRTIGTDQLGPLPGFVTDGAGRPLARTTAPTGDRIWVVYDYELGRTVLTDPRFSRAAAAAPNAPRFNTSNPAPTSIMSMDGGDHARLRRLVATAFNPRRMASITPMVEELAGHLLDGIEHAGSPADLIAAYASPLPFAVVATLLGVPASDRAVFGEWVGVLFDVTVSNKQEKARRSFALFDYMSTLVDRKLRDPGDDLLTTLTQAHQNGMLSRTELIDLGLALLTAGYETTVGQIGLAALAVLNDPAPDARDRAATDSAALVEELLRLSPSTPLSFPRVALEAVRLGGVLIEAGDGLVVSLLHANRDAAVFAEPDRVAAEGRPSAHLTFGHGPHYCLGAPLARLQVSTAIGALFRRLPEAQVALGDAVRWSDGLAIRALTRLMVTW